MRAPFRDNLFEALVGLLVLILAFWFLYFAWGKTGGGIGQTIHVTALFPAANGVDVGTDVRIAGMRVGSVTGERLDPESYQAELTLALDRDVQVPSDSSAAITSEGLLGGTHVALLPGGSDAPLKDGDMILDTQGSIDMMSLIGSVINRPSGGGGGEPQDTTALDDAGTIPQ
jgi:phospholipid/cholesterol/gamma-HCH transport system substrate-binding protein